LFYLKAKSLSHHNEVKPYYFATSRTYVINAAINPRKISFKIVNFDLNCT